MLLFMAREGLTGWRKRRLAEPKEMRSQPELQPSACPARHGRRRAPRAVGLARAASVAAVCEEGRAGQWGAVVLAAGPGQLPVLAVVEHLASLRPPVRPPPPPLGFRVWPGPLGAPAGSFTAAETGRWREQEMRDGGTGPGQV